MLFHKYRPFRRNYQPEEAILLLYCRFDIKNQRFAPQGRQHLHPFQDIAPIPPRIERHLQRGMLSGKDGTPIVFRQDATAIRLGSADDERPAVRILQRKLLHARPPEAVPNRTYPAGQPEESNRTPPIRFRTRPGPEYDARTRYQTPRQRRGEKTFEKKEEIFSWEPDTARCHSTSPRPVLLILPSLRSDSTILSSTPLMKRLLPGVL